MNTGDDQVNLFLNGGLKNKNEKQKCQQMIDYLSTTLLERKSLAEKLNAAQRTKELKEQEYKHKQQLCADFPQLLQKLEDASIPLQEFLDVKITSDRIHKEIVARLPNPLANLYTKLKVYEQQRG